MSTKNHLRFLFQEVTPSVLLIKVCRFLQALVLLLPHWPILPRRSLAKTSAWDHWNPKKSVNKIINQNETVAMMEKTYLRFIASVFFFVHGKSSLRCHRTSLHSLPWLVQVFRKGTTQKPAKRLQVLKGSICWSPTPEFELPRENNPPGSP